MPAKAETVSVIVPIFNAEATLRRCLSSLRKQTYPDLEILMLDDGSTDGSPSVCREFADADPRFRFFPLPPRHNVAAVRNSGLERFTGEYLMFADADDLVS
nr:glycosyltransferase family 2 protein [Lachnospiraceae bacterium]